MGGNVGYDSSQIKGGENVNRSRSSIPLLMFFGLKMFIPHSYTGKVSTAYYIKRPVHVRSIPNQQLNKIYNPKRDAEEYFSIISNNNKKII